LHHFPHFLLTESLLLELKDGDFIFAIMREYRYYFSLSSLEDIGNGFFRNRATFSGDISLIIREVSSVKSDP